MINEKANAAGMVAIVLWASSALIVTFTGHIPSMLLSSIASFVGFLFCSFYWVFKRDHFIDKFRLSLKAYALGIFGVCGYTALWLTGLKLAPAFEANALNYLWPLFLFLFSAKIDHHPVSRFQIIGFLFGIIGSLLIFVRYGVEAHQNLAHLMGLSCALAGALVWAVYSALAKKVHYQSDSVGVFLLITAIITFVLHMIFERGVGLSLSLSNVIAICLLGASRVSFIFWDYAMKRGDRQFLSSLSYLIPVLSVALLALFTPVEWTRQIFAGAVLIILGCLLGNGEKIYSLYLRKRQKI